MARGQTRTHYAGVGPRRAALIRLLPYIARRYFEQSVVVGEPLRSPADTEAYLLARLGHRRSEGAAQLRPRVRHAALPARTM